MPCSLHTSGTGVPVSTYFAYRLRENSTKCCTYLKGGGLPSYKPTENNVEVDIGIIHSAALRISLPSLAIPCII